MMTNENRIVRVQNDKIHSMISEVSYLSDVAYQHVFNEFCDYILDGYIVGSESTLVLVHRVLKAVKSGKYPKRTR